MEEAAGRGNTVASGSSKFSALALLIPEYMN